MTATSTSFDSLFNEISSEQDVSARYKGHARNALKYANFDLQDIDDPSLAKKIIQSAIDRAVEEEAKTHARTASFSVQLPVKRTEHGPTCPRCKSATPMQNIELLDNVKARYCAQCRLTDISG